MAVLRDMDLAIEHQNKWNNFYHLNNSSSQVAPRKCWISLPPVAQSQILAASNFNKHHLRAEEQLLHDVGEEAGVHLWIGQSARQSAAALDELVTAGSLVTVQGQDRDTEVRTGSLGTEGRKVNTSNVFST